MSEQYYTGKTAVAVVFVHQCARVRDIIVEAHVLFLHVRYDALAGHALVEPERGGSGFFQFFGCHFEAVGIYPGTFLVAVPVGRAGAGYHYHQGYRLAAFVGDGQRAFQFHAVRGGDRYFPYVGLCRNLGGRNSRQEH